MNLPIFSRQQLQDLKWQKPYLQTVEMIVRAVYSEAQRGYNTRYVFNAYQLGREQKVDILIPMLQTHLPDVTIEYREQTQLNGNLEKAIIIDWS
jgi:hypothetical protein